MWTAPMDEVVERLCEVMHDAYEAAAVDQGWQTNPRSRKPWPEVPAENKATMRLAVAAAIDDMMRILRTGVVAP